MKDRASNATSSPAQRSNRLLVIIPTRNRADLAKTAIESVLKAGLPQVRVLVSDNSTDEKHSLSVRSICALHPPGRVSYIRPENPLAMAEHWDWAMRQAMADMTTTHFLYLTDRMVFKPDSLERLTRLSERYPERVITFSFDRVNDNETPITVTQHEWTNNVYEVTSLSTLKVCSEMRFDDFLPRMLNSVVPRFVIRSMLDRFGNCFSSSAPDFNFCFRFLLLFDSFLFVDRALAVHYALSRSNGATQNASGVPNKDNEDLFNKASGKFNLENTLIPEIATVGNTIIYEYARVQKEYGSRRFPPVLEDKYLNYLADEIAEIQDLNRRQEWQNLIQEHRNQNNARSQSNGAPKSTRLQVSALVRGAARRAAGKALHLNPELVLRLTPHSARKLLAANKWKFPDVRRALFWALHFECANEGSFPRAHNEGLQCTALAESD